MCFGLEGTIYENSVLHDNIPSMKVMGWDRDGLGGGGALGFEPG